MSTTEPVDTLETTGAYPKYDEYEDSEVDWLGAFPKHWSTAKIRHLFRVQNGSTPASTEDDYWNGDLIWVTPEDLGNYERGVIDDSSRHITEEGLANCGASLVPEGSIVLSTRAPIGLLGVAGVELCTNQGCRALEFQFGDSTRFFYYQLLAANQELKSWGQGSTFQELSSEELRAVQVSRPPVEEQRAIATFLDRETGRIDALIEKKEELIDLLEEKRTALISRVVTEGLDRDVEMQDSGVEWLGEIPLRWKVANLKHYADVFGRIGWRGYTRQDLRESGPLVLGASHITRTGELDLSSTVHISREKYDESPRIKLRGGEVLVVKVGATIGKVAVIPGDLGEATINPNVMLIRPNEDDLAPEYLGYLLASRDYSQTLKADSSAGAQDAITQTFVGYLPCLIPPLSTQRSIVNHLNREESKIKSLIKKVEKGIERLKEYRTALISAAVTGQIDVREEVSAVPAE